MFWLIIFTTTILQIKLSLRSKGSKALLKLDKDGKLLVLGRDLGNVRDGNGITTWTHLTECDIIEENQVWYQDRKTHLYGIHNIYYGEKYRHYFQDAIYSNNLSLSFKRFT